MARKMIIVKRCKRCKQGSCPYFGFKPKATGRIFCGKDERLFYEKVSSKDKIPEDCPLKKELGRWGRLLTVRQLMNTETISGMIY